MAEQISKFDVRSMKNNFTNNIANAETEDQVNEIIQQVLSDVDEFRAYLDSELVRIVGVAEGNENIAEELVQEARDAADSIREGVNELFADASGEGELQSSAKVTEIQFRNLLSSYEGQFENNDSKDQVDETVK